MKPGAKSGLESGAKAGPELGKTAGPTGTYLCAHFCILPANCADPLRLIGPIDGLRPLARHRSRRESHLVKYFAPLAKLNIRRNFPLKLHAFAIKNHPNPDMLAKESVFLKAVLRIAGLVT